MDKFFSATSAWVSQGLHPSLFLAKIRLGRQSFQQAEDDTSRKSVQVAQRGRLQRVKLDRVLVIQEEHTFWDERMEMDVDIRSRARPLNKRDGATARIFDPLLACTTSLPGKKCS